MFTKKTRVISAIAAVCMLLSLMASFCLPVAAASNYDEIVPAKGLTDVSGLPDIKNGFKASITAYQVTDRSGMEIIAKQVARKTKMEGYTFTMAKDIDMSGTPFAGIGSASLNDIDSAANAALTYNQDFYTFRGVFDGNGFVFTNLYMYIGSSYGVGLFGNCYGATIKNVGIASGLIVGAGRTGAIVGLAQGGTELINCWNAATVVGGGTTGVGGLVGCVVDGETTLANCYNLGLVYNARESAAGLVGEVRDDATGFAVNNSYSAGTLIDGFKGLDSSSLDYFGAIMRIQNEEIATSTKSANNFYLNTIGKAGWAMGKELAEDAFDGAASFTADDFSELHESLNKKIASDSEDYEVAYGYSEAGYPVLTYLKDGAVVAKRLPAADAKNVVGNDWAEENELFAKISAAAGKNGALSFGGKGIDIASADDLFIFGIFAAFNSINSNFGVTEVRFVNDVDMNDLTLINVDYYIPIGANSTVDYHIDGKNHTLYNWKSYTFLPAAQANAMGGFICEINGGSLKNISLENAKACYDQYYKAVATAGYSYPALVLERVNGSAYVHDVTATGEIQIMAQSAANDNNNAGIVGRHWGDTLTMNNCWSEATVTHVFDDNASYVIYAIGSSNGAASVSKYENVFWIEVEGTKGLNEYIDGNPMAKDELQLHIDPEDFHTIEIAHQMNESAKLLKEDDGAFWTVGKNGKTKLTRSTDESEKPVVLLLQRNVSTAAGTAIYGEPDRIYRYKGETYTPGADDVPGYLLDAAVEGPIVLNDDYTTVNFYMDTPDTTYLRDAENLLDTFGSVESEYIENLRTALEKVDKAEGKEAKRNAIYEAAAAFNAAKEAVSKGELYGEYPYYPAISRYNELKEYNFTDWSINTKEDWLFATRMVPQDVATLRLHLTANIDMEKEVVWPLAYGTTFIGLVDGHGYNFYNFNMTVTDPNGFSATEGGVTVHDNSFGLVAHLGNNGVIQNVGLASGTVNISDVCSQDQGIGGFAGVAESNSLIANCWNGLAVNASNKSGSNVSRIGGIVGRGAGILYGCYNIGTVSGNEKYVHGLNAYASNGGGRFYNCYNLLASGSSKTYNTAIGQGGSYQNQTTAAATPYQNTYSVGTHLIYGYSTHPSAAIVECSKTHSISRVKYDSGLMAYTMNSNLYSYNDLPDVYWTLNDDGMTVFGTEANSVRRLTITLGGETLEVRYVNGDATIQVAVDGYDISDIEIVSGTAQVSGEYNDVLTMMGSDVEIALSVDCRHIGTLTYTPDADSNATHSWFCSACEAGEEGVLCTHDGEWSDNEDGTHSETCICGREITETCQYANAEKQAGDTHLASCICGAEKIFDCSYDGYEIKENNQHQQYCVVCQDYTALVDCTFGQWEIVKAPALGVKGEKCRKCVCGNYETEEIAALTGAALTLSAPVAHADEQVEVEVNLDGIPTTAGNALVAKVKYDAAIFDYESAVADGCNIQVLGDDAGELKIAFIWSENITEGMGKFATLTFNVAKSATAGRSVMEVSPYTSSAILNGVDNVTIVSFTGGINLIDVEAYPWGDASGDKKVTLVDVILLLRKANGEDLSLDVAGDVWNNALEAEGSDGIYTIADATWVLKQLLKK